MNMHGLQSHKLQESEQYFMNYYLLTTGHLPQLPSISLQVQEACGSIPGLVKSDTMSPTACHRCDVSSELCCPGAKPRRWTPPLVMMKI